MFVAKFPGSTYATQAMNAGPMKGNSARSPRRSPESDRSAASSTRASPGSASSTWTNRLRGGSSPVGVCLGDADPRCKLPGDRVVGLADSNRQRPSEGLDLPELDLLAGD